MNHKTQFLLFLCMVFVGSMDAGNGEDSVINDPGLWNRMAEGYAAKPVADQAAYETKLAMTRDLFTPQSEVIEFGCGTGTTALIHAPHVRHILATDLSENMIAIARRKAREQGCENVDFDIADIDTFSYPDGQFDIVMMHSLLHLLYDRRPAIAKAYDLLKPGGHLVTSTACLSGWWRLIWPVVGAMRLAGRAPLVRFFSREKLRGEFEKAGFTIEVSWAPPKGASVFVIARKPDHAAIH